jgi:hypothetical protein
LLFWFIINERIIADVLIDRMWMSDSAPVGANSSAGAISKDGQERQWLNHSCVAEEMCLPVYLALGAEADVAEKH